MTRTLISEGIPADEARRKALLSFGGSEQIKEECRDVRPLQWIDRLLQNLRYGMRLLFRNPGFSAVVIAVLTLAIGVNIAVFAVVDSVLLRPLPYPDPGRLVRIWGNFTGIGLPDNRNAISAPEFQDFKRLNRSFSYIAAVSPRVFIVSSGNETWRADGAAVSADFFPMLGVQPELGRFFSEENETPGRDRTVVISHGLWKTRFGGDSEIIGRGIRIDGSEFQIGGVLPNRFQFELGSGIDIWRPLAFQPDELAPSSRGNHGLAVIARIKPDLSIEQARADAQAMTRAIIEENRNYPYERYDFAVVLSPLMEEVVGEVRTPLRVLMAAVCAVLLIACANVAALLLSRARARRSEMAVRIALGARRGTLIVQMLTESVVLGLAGGAGGLLLAWWLLEILKTMAHTSVPRIDAASLNPAIVAFAAGLSLLTAVIFGLAPAWNNSHSSSYSGLKESRRTTGGMRSQRLQKTLVVAELAISLIMLVSTGLLLRSFHQLLQVDPGFRPDRVLTMRISFRSPEGDRPEVPRQFYREVADRISHLPAVRTVGGINALPLTGQGSSGTIFLDTQAVPADKRSPEADVRVVLPGYFKAMGIRLIRGRTFDARDTDTSMPCTVIDESMADRYWPDEDPVGKRLKRGGPDSELPWLTVIGVVAHVRYRTLEAPSRTEYYLPHSQSTNRSMTLTILTEGDPTALAESVRRAVAAVDPEQPPYQIRTMDQVVSQSVARREILTMMLAGFAGCALLLAAVGLYGVMSYAVSQRAHEIGIRITLGGTVTQILRMVVGQGLALAGVGAALGLAGSVVVSQWLSSLLFHVRPEDPVTLVAAAGTLVVIALAASCIPARRAARMDPAVILRGE